MLRMASVVLFTSPVNGPAAATAAPAARTESTSSRSISKGRTASPCTAVSRSASPCRRTVAHTTMPSRTSAVTAAAPIPVDAPVTTTDRLSAISATSVLSCWVVSHRRHKSKLGERALSEGSTVPDANRGLAERSATRAAPRSRWAGTLLTHTPARTAHRQISSLAAPVKTRSSRIGCSRWPSTQAARDVHHRQRSEP